MKSAFAARRYRDSAPLTRSRAVSSRLTLLRSLVEQKGRKWSAIGKRLNRHPSAVKNKYDVIMMGSSRNSGPWTTAETSALRRAVAANESEDGTIHWVAVAKAVGSRDPTQCLNKWSALQPWSPQQDLQLLGEIERQGVSSLKEVDWAEIKAGKTHMSRHQRAKQLFKRLSRSARSSPFPVQLNLIISRTEVQRLQMMGLSTPIVPAATAAATVTAAAAVVPAAAPVTSTAVSATPAASAAEAAGYLSFGADLSGEAPGGGGGGGGAGAGSHVTPIAGGMSLASILGPGALDDV